MKTKNSNFQSLKVTSYNCFFSEVCEVSHGMLQHKKALTSNQLNNCFVTFENNQILIISQGGNRFQLPMDQQILRIIPLAQGILIQFTFKQQPKLSEILFYQRSKSMMEIQQNGQGKYCYATINRHPLNPLKILGEIRNQQIIPWLKVQEKVTCVSDLLPIMLTYNLGLYRNAFHIILANTKQVNKEYQYAFLSTHTYSLKNVGDSNHSQLLTQTIFQQSHQSQQIIEIQLNKSSKAGCVILYARTLNEIRVFELNLYAMTNSTRLLTIVKFPLAIRPASLYPPQMFFPHPFNRYKKGLLIDIIETTIQGLPDSVAIINKHSISYYHAGQTINSVGLSEQAKLNLSQNKLQKNIIPISLISNHFDALVIRVLQTALEDQQTFLTLLRKYCCGQPLLSSLINVYKKVPKILTILHYFYEELKLYELMSQQRKKVGELVIEIALQDSLCQYIDYYLRQGYHITKQISKLPIKSQQEVYDMFSNFSRMVCQVLPRNIPLVLFSRTQFLYNFMQLLVLGKIVQPSESFSRDLTHSKYQHGKEYFYRNRYPLLSQKVFHLDYYDSIYEDLSFKEVQAGTKQQQAFLYLVNHNHNHHDILSYPLSIRAIFYCILRQMRLELPYTLYDMIPKLGFYLIHREDLYKNIRLYKRTAQKIPYHLTKPSFDEHIKTLVHTSTSHQYFLTSNASEMNKLNNDLVFEEVNRLLSTSSQIHVKAKDIQSIPEDRWQIQSQNILQKFANRRLAVLIGQGSFTLGTSRSFITDIIKIPKINLSAIMPNDIKITLDLKEDKESLVFWPQFHSGMAAGLRLSRHVIPLSQDHLKTWIFYQKPDTPKRDHSGFLLSLGLLGYLRCFSPTDIYQYLKPNNQFTSVAILLGVSASNISRSEQAISKTLILHIPVLLPPTVDVEIPINVQTSALIGLGLLHKGTCNRSMAEMTLSQIGKKPSTDKCLDREGYSLAAGWALGMICLGVGDKKESFRDLHLEQRLIRFIEGGKKMQPPQSMMSSTNYVNENKCSSIKQGPNVNLHITAPSALLAISLMYLKSNNRDLSDKISIPNSFNTIEECNPNHILLKTLAKNLIMWQQISNTKQFIHSQVPQLIKFIYENPLSKVYERYYLVYNVSQIDYQTISTIYASVMTGGILSMSLKYAGTGNRAAMETIKWHIEQLKTIKIIKCEFANDPMNKNCIDQYELFSLLSTSLLSLSIVMAGTCDIECLKIIRIVRKKFQDSKVFHYGFSMAINMSIGFIFLGYGNYTFNRQDMSIAALLISVFPQYPNSPTDNKWHLQALRHFYVLAMEEKIFHAVDVDTNKVVNVSTEMQFLVDGQVVTESLHTPILLQQSKKLLRVKIKDQDYFDVDFAFDISKPDPKAIYIKRKHFRDINEQIMNPQNPLSTDIARNNIQKCLQHQHRYTSLIGFDKKNDKLSYLLPKSKNLDKIKLSSSSVQFPHQIYYTLLKEDKMEMLQIYLTLKHQLKNINIKKSDSLLINNINLLLTFQKSQSNQMLSDMIRQIIQTHQIDILSRPQFKNYLNDPYSKKKNQLSPVSFHQLLKLINIPSSRNIFLIRDAINKLKSKPQSFSIIQMLLYTTFPECSFTLLHKLLLSYYN